MTRSQRLLTVLALNLALVAGLVAAGAVAGSLAVLATGGDYLLDAAAVGIALLAARLAGPSAEAARTVRPRGPGQRRRADQRRVAARAGTAGRRRGGDPPGVRAPRVSKGCRCCWPAAWPRW